jgi:hypothetical protein
MCLYFNILVTMYRVKLTCTYLFVQRVNAEEAIPSNVSSPLGCFQESLREDAGFQLKTTKLAENVIEEAGRRQLA